MGVGRIFSRGRLTVVKSYFTSSATKRKKFFF